MRAILLIAKNTFKEIIRDKILYALIFVSMIMLLFASAMAQLSFAEQAKITMDFSLFVLNIATIIISIFLGAQLLFREVENKTLLTLLTHPVKRSEFLMGKIVGLFYIVLCLSLFFGLILFLQSKYYNYGSSSDIFLSMLGILLESSIVLTLTIFLSTFLRVSLVITLSLTLYLIGHLMEGLNTLSNEVGMNYLKSIYSFFKYSVPNLELMNWKALLANNIVLSKPFIGQVTLYSLMWVSVFIFLSVLIFNKKDIS